MKYADHNLLGDYFSWPDLLPPLPGRQLWRQKGDDYNYDDGDKDDDFHDDGDHDDDDFHDDDDDMMIFKDDSDDDDGDDSETHIGENSKKGNLF